MKPYAFARAEAARRNLVVEKVPKGDVRLHGGRALYDPDALLILHEETGDEFTNAFLVSHEIGHVETNGQSEPSVTLDADPLRCAEAVPVGVDRVQDYSRRQRREVLMDLFAREFLLPRNWARATASHRRWAHGRLDCIGNSAHPMQSSRNSSSTHLLLLPVCQRIPLR